jgi:hypothetical protein
MLNPVRFGDALGDAAGDALRAHNRFLSRMDCHTGQTLKEHLAVVDNQLCMVRLAKEGCDNSYVDLGLV